MIIFTYTILGTLTLKQKIYTLFHVPHVKSSSLSFLFFLEDQDSTIEKNLFDHMICHHEDTPMLLNISGQKYVLPANCSFLLSDASNLNPLLDYGRSPIIVIINFIYSI